MWIMKFYSFDLDFDPITLVLKLDLNIIKMYVCAKYVVSNWSASHGLNCMKPLSMGKENLPQGKQILT